jgi:hypothetical protein
MRLDSGSRIARPGSLAIGPHRIDARVALSIFDDTDTRIVPPDGVRTVPLDRLWPAAATARASYREVRTLGTHSINLFGTYPEDFPRQIAQPDAIASVSRWLRLDRVRTIRVDPPVGPGCVRFALPGFRAEVYCPGQRAGATHSIRVYELIGHMDKEMPTPLATEAIVRLGDRADPVLKFTLCLGAGYFSTGTALQYGSNSRVSTIVWEDQPLGRPLSSTLRVASRADGLTSCLHARRHCRHDNMTNTLVTRCRSPSKWRAFWLGANGDRSRRVAKSRTARVRKNPGDGCPSCAAIRQQFATGEFQLAPQAEGVTLRAYAATWLQATTGTFNARQSRKPVLSAVTDLGLSRIT